MSCGHLSNIRWVEWGWGKWAENKAVRQEVGESIRWTKQSVEMSMSHRGGEAAGMQVLSSGNYGNTSRKVF